MENPFEIEIIEEIKKDLQDNGPAAAAAKIQEHLDQQDKILLNIGITGETGAGKSTFVNAFRGIRNRAEGAAPTGAVETTTVQTPYPHPKYPNVTLWDLPGIGSPSFKADEYLEKVGFEKFDFFIIISADRFRENDVKLALEVKRMKKKFYFVRSKIDHSMRDEERDQDEFSPERTLKLIRENCIQGLQAQGVESPQVFLVSSVELHLYDFSQLVETLERELPAHKKDVLLKAVPNISLEIINKKKEAFQAKIKWYAASSALIAAAPVAGVSFAADITMITKVVGNYQTAFDLDKASLEKLALSAKVPLSELEAVMTSPLATNVINTDRIIKVISLSLGEAALMAAEEGARFIPLIGIPAAMGCSFLSTYRAMSHCLDMLADDAQRVFTKALGLNSTV